MLSKLPVFQAVNTWCPNFRTLTIRVRLKKIMLSVEHESFETKQLIRVIRAIRVQ